MSGFDSTTKDGKPRDILFKMSCGHGAIISMDVTRAKGLVGTIAFCNRHGKVNVLSADPVA